VKLHLGNIKGDYIDISFIPYRGAFTRGIITTSYFNCTLEESQLIKLYKNYYSDHPFVHVSENNPDLKMVINTNQCVLYPSVKEGKAIIISVIDNLIKGASGQAIQNMNLMLGYEESTGLNLKSTYF
jgi:N-acetyl-gamma-glutamyl-phosphate reductase